MKVVIRKFDPDTDKGLIFDSFAKGVYAGQNDNSRKKAFDRDWFAQFHEYVKAMLEVATIKMACADNDHTHLIGYSIIYHEPDAKRLEYVFVKEGYRNQGIATLLTKNSFDIINYSNLTRVGAIILAKHPELEDHGSEETIDDNFEDFED